MNFRALFAAFCAVFCVFASLAWADDPKSTSTDQPRKKPYLIFNNKGPVAACEAPCPVGANSQIFALPTSDYKTTDEYGNLISHDFLANFNISPSNWILSPKLDRAIVAAYRYFLSAQDEGDLASIARIAGLDEEDVTAALPILRQARWGKMLDVAAIRTLQTRLGFTAEDILRLPKSQILDTALRLYGQDPNLFAADKWQKLFSEIENLWSDRTDDHQLQLLTIPAGVELKRITSVWVKGYLFENLGEFVNRFATLQELLDKIPSDRRPSVVAAMCEAATGFYIGRGDAQITPYGYFASNHIMSFLVANQTPGELIKFTVLYIREILHRMTPDRRVNIVSTVRILIKGAMPFIQANTGGISDDLLDELVTRPRDREDGVFDIVEMLIPVWIEQGRLQDEKTHTRIVAQFTKMFEQWRQGFSTTSWRHIDWPARFALYRSVVGPAKTNLEDINWLTDKFSIPPHSSVNVWPANEEQLVHMLHYFVTEAPTPKLKLERLMAIAKAYQGSLVQRLMSYPIFESELTEQLIKYVKDDPEATKNLWEQIKPGLATKDVTATPFLSDFDSLFRNAAFAAEYESVYLERVALYLGRMVTGSSGADLANSYLEFDDTFASFLYSQFRLRASQQMLHDFIEDEIPYLAGGHFTGNYLIMVLQDRERLQGMKQLSAAPPPKLTVYTCVDIVRRGPRKPGPLSGPLKLAY